MTLQEEIKYNALDEETILFENVDLILEGINVNKLNKKIDRFVKIGKRKKVIGVENFGNNIKKLSAQLYQVQAELAQAKKNKNVEEIKVAKQKLKKIKYDVMLSYKIFRKGINSHRKTALKLFFALSSVLGMFLFIGVRNSRKQKYSMMMSQIKGNINKNKEMLDTNTQKNIDKEFEAAIKE